MNWLYIYLFLNNETKITQVKTYSTFSLLLNLFKILIFFVFIFGGIFSLNV